ncbi:MAG: ATP synthase F1 subunit delta [Candidatus Omnitrophica bacterium]|nr:ATP synthase F1 subunit delta [Candidatus Omnitrophota bacterium]MDD5610653.1 ATP synthase F1 subunit delta [Candidatus Omnitrophota bacterium]
MIRGEIIVRRYCEAFIEFTEHTIGLERCVEQIKALKNIIAHNPEFMELLLSPAITQAEKFRFIDEVLKDNFSQEISFFLKLVVEKGRTMFLTGMLDYIRVNYSHGEAVEAVLKSANLLDIETIKEIQKKVQIKLGKKMYFYLELDPSLLAGVEVAVGNTVIDGSLKRRMEDLRHELKMTKIS